MKVLHSFWLPLLIFVFTSCHSLVDNEFPNYSQKPVLNGLLQADSALRVQVTFTSNLTESVPSPVANAQVIIENSTNSPDTLTYTQKGWYVSPHRAKAGVSYTCKVNIPGLHEMSAQATVPEPTKIDSITFTDLAGRGEEGEKISSVEFNIHNSLSTNRYWQVQLISEGMRMDFDQETGKWIESFGTNSEYIYMLAGQDTVLLNEANPLTIFSNKFMIDDQYKVKFYYNVSYTNFSSDEVVYVVLRSIDKTYYNHLKQYYIYESASYTDIGKTPQKYPLYSNVTNGLGVFTALSVTRKMLNTHQTTQNP